MTVFFTSDTHFGHNNIIKFSERPFESFEDMDEALIERWNSVVGENDEIYHLGDFSFHRPQRTEGILWRLKGKKHFIWGNHDKGMDKLLNFFQSVSDYKEISVEGQKIILSHYPILSWNKAHYGSWHLHGHCHGSINYLNTQNKRIDVGVDNFNYTPVSFEEIAQIMTKRSIVTVDHHTAEGRRMR